MNVTPIHRKSNKDLAAQLASQLRCQEEAQVMGSAGDPISRPAKHKQFWLRQDGPPLYSSGSDDPLASMLVGRSVSAL